MIWKLDKHWHDHCPGGCYLFRREPEPHPLGRLHVPVEMFWGRQPWRWSRFRR